MVPLAEERDVDTLRQINLLLDRENQRLAEKVRQLTAELARLRGLPHSEQLELALRQDLARIQAQVRDARSAAPVVPAPPSPPSRVGHGPHAQPDLPIVERHHALPSISGTAPRAAAR
jgi:hypothetical protein